MGVLRPALRAILLPLVAALLLFEEWGWAPLAALFARLARLPFWARVERGIAGLSPRWAVLVFGVPMLLLLPVKLPALTQVAWFARWYPRWKAWKDGVLAQVRSSGVWHMGQALRQSAKDWWSALRR